MIRSYFGLTDNPFALRDIELLEHQQEIHDTLNVHCQQGGLCLVVGTPGHRQVGDQGVAEAASRTSSIWSPPSRGRCTPTPTR